MIFHPAAKILLWITFALVVQRLHPAGLWASTLAVALLLTRMAWQRFYFLFNRTRWLFLSILLIYAYAIPGEPIWPAWGTFSPSWVGLDQGGYQVLRLLLMLGGLAVLLACCNRAEFLGGLYVLLKPFKALGFNPERVAVRIGLTLHYANQQVLLTRNWYQELTNALEPPPMPAESIPLVSYPLHWWDILMVLSSIGVAGVCLL